MVILPNRRSHFRSSPFSPSSIAGLKVWLKSDAITGLNDGESLSSWVDSSSESNDATQATADNQPSYQTNELNTKPVVRFDGTSDFMTLDTLLELSDFTAIIVGKVTNTGSVLLGYSVGNRQMLSISESGANTTLRCYQDIDDFNTCNLYESTALDDPLPTDWTVWSVSRSTDTFYFYEDNVARGNAGTNSRTFRSNVVGATLVSTGPDVYAGFTAGDIAEIIIYNSAISTEDRASVHTYINAKYGFS